MKWDYCTPVHEAPDIELPIEYSAEAITGIDKDKYYRGS